MASEFSEAIRMLVQERGIPEELAYKTVEDLLIAAYKRRFNTADNAVVKFSEDGSDVTLYAKKRIVEDVYDPVSEIELEEALEFSPDCEIGDELLIELNPKDFDRGEVQSAKQKTRQNLSEIKKDTLYSEFKEKEGEMIIGYFQRTKHDTIFVDLGKIEGILPKKYQSPREKYGPGDRIRSMIYEVVKTGTGLQIVLSRTHTEFVRKIFELEVPEISDRTVEIFKIVREAGYRTKIAVFSNRGEVDPVGACVGLKGVRIQSIVRELEGEKVDIIKYEIDPKQFIRNALTPAEVSQVIILDDAKRQALVVVPDDQLSLAIGKQGGNVKLANRLVDWTIDVKTEAQFAEMDIALDPRRAASAIFSDDEEEEEISRISELPGMPERLVDILRDNGLEFIASIVNFGPEDFARLPNLTEDDVKLIFSILNENVEIVDEQEAPVVAQLLDGEGVAQTDESGYDETSTGEETYECPDCGSPITVEMTVCPHCGVGLSFEFEEEAEEEE